MSDIAPVKRCPKCKETKAINEFPKDKNCKDGHGSYCKECRKQYARNNKERIIATAQKWQRENKEKTIASIRKWEAQNPEKKKAYRKAAYERLTIKLDNDPIAKEKERVRKLKTATDWIKAHPDRHRINRNKRQERIKEHQDHYTSKEWLILCAVYEYQCACCGKTKPLCADHVVPLIKGGADTIDNIQPLCRTCNSKKGIQTIDYRTKK